MPQRNWPAAASGRANRRLFPLTTRHPTSVRRFPKASFFLGKENEAGILINNSEWYETQGIALKLRTVIANVDLKKKELRSNSGETFEYETLLIATGARARKLDCRGRRLAQRFLSSIDG